jgi:hypothetical protein
MTVLMTGFPGFLGSALLPHILRRTDGAATCLVQSKFAALAMQRVTELSTADPAMQGRIQVVEGDITQPGLGLGADALDEVTEAWHLAAVYDLAVSREAAVRINVDGTRNVLDALERCPRLTRLHFQVVLAERAGVAAADVAGAEDQAPRRGGRAPPNVRRDAGHYLPPLHRCWRQPHRRDAKVRRALLHHAIAVAAAAARDHADAGRSERRDKPA